MTKDLSTNEKSAAMQRYEEALGRFPVLDPDEIEERSLMKALTAQSAEEVLFSPESESLSDIVGEPFVLLGIEGFLPSTKKGNEGELYGILSCARDDGTTFSCTTGSKYALTRAMRLVELGALPRRVVGVGVVSKSDPDRTSLWIVDRPLRADPARSAPVEATSRPSGGAPDDEPF